LPDPRDILASPLDELRRRGNRKDEATGGEPDLDSKGGSAPAPEAGGKAATDAADTTTKEGGSEAGAGIGAGIGAETDAGSAGKDWGGEHVGEESKSETASTEKDAGQTPEKAPDKAAEKSTEKSPGKTAAKAADKAGSGESVKSSGGSSGQKAGNAGLGDVGGEMGAGGKDPGGVDGASATKGETGAAKGGKGESHPTFTAPQANDASVSDPLPSSFNQTETVVQGAAQAGASGAVVSPEAAEAARNSGWAGARKAAASAGGFVLATLKSAAVGNFAALWDSGTRSKIGAEFSKAGKALGETKGLAKVAAGLDVVYTSVDTAGGFLGPLGTVLGLVSYARYIPVPPIPAIGAGLHVVAQIVRTINFVLDIVRLAISALRPMVDVIGLALARDPEQRKHYRERLVADAIAFGANGASFALGAFLDKGFRGGYKGAGPKVGHLGKVRAGLKVYGTDQWKSVAGLFKANAIRNMYKETLSDAAARALRVRTVMSIRLIAQKQRAGLAQARAGRIRAIRAQQARARLIMQRRRQLDWKRARELAGEMANEGGSAVASAGASGGIQAMGESKGTAPRMDPPANTTQVTPVIEPILGSGAAATQAAVTDPQTPLIAKGQIPPEETDSAPIHLKAMDEQQASLDESRKELESQAAAAAAGQDEALTIEKAAKGQAQEADQTKATIQAQHKETALEGAEVDKIQAKVQEGKAQQGKADAGFTGVKGDAGKAESAVPSGRVDRSKVSVIQRPFLWVADKFEAARNRITEAMTGIVMKIVSGATGMDDLAAGMTEAETTTQRRKQDLAQEPGDLTTMEGVASKESVQAKALQEKAREAQAKDAACAETARTSLDEVQKADTSLSKEKQQAEKKSATYAKEHGPAFEQYNKAVEAEQRKDLAPAELDLGGEVKAVDQALDKVEQDQVRHGNQVRMEIMRRRQRIAETRRIHQIMRMRQQGQQAGDESGAADSGKDNSEQIRARLELARQHRIRLIQVKRQRALALRARAKQVRKAADVEDVAKLSGEVTSESRSFDQEKAAELRELYEEFMEEMKALFE
jgi:hypothetical protein